jgi:mandelate racemase
MALSALDAALWDAVAVAAGVPLATLLGSAPRPLRAYNSCGLGLMTPAAAADEAERLLEGGFEAVSCGLGYATLDEDLAVTRAVRRRLADDVALMVDYNQALSVDDALARGARLQSEGVSWLEEPIRHDDHRGNAAIAARSTCRCRSARTSTGRTTCERRSTRARATSSCRRRAHRRRQRLDAGGRARGATRLPMSSHLMPELSGHLLAATPTCHWLEYVDWADVLVQEPLRIDDGHAVVPGPSPAPAWCGTTRPLSRHRARVGDASKRRRRAVRLANGAPAVQSASMPSHLRGGATIRHPGRHALRSVARGNRIEGAAMSELKLYEHELSGNAYKVRLFLSLLGLPFTAERVDLFKGAGQHPDYLAISAMGQVPALVDGDARAARFAGDPVLPRAHARQRPLARRRSARPGANARLALVRANELANGPAALRIAARFKRPSTSSGRPR